MDDEQFASELKSVAVDEYLRIYEKALRSGVADGSDDPLIRLFGAVSGEDQRVLLAAVRQVCVDAISQVLGVIDGTTSLPGVRAGLELRPPGEERIDGDLQSEFLVLFEDE